MNEDDVQRLTAVLVRAGGVGVSVETVTVLTGGASSATYAVDAVRDGAAWPLILQRAAAGEVVAGGFPKADQAALQMLAGRRGIPVADVVAVLTPEDGLGHGFVMTRVAGEALAPRYLRDEKYAAARAAMTGQCAAVLATLHSVPLAEVAGLALAGGRTAAAREQMFERYRAYGVESPVFDMAFAWLAERCGDAEPTSVVHGDFRSGNFIVDEQGLAAVLDWELAHLGEGAEDLGWLCANAWRFGNWQKPVGGFGEREELYDAYAAAGGARIDRARAHMWEVWGTLRWGLSCLQLGHDHVSGRVISVERAAIGRRVSEVELDLVHLIRFGEI
ncbi:tyrosine protein kinase:aminoglycoside phosphotransferase [Polymorphobacter glacialis]|uniref:Tyrosine protein kinase:aminoglycoside phosphotransferase n=1 Tax=Sandarakinorhabdus glacialis TaxID=1614636 RepID=A0A916ZNE6_9SPHN|nr:phosphotransferase family protein [Polymorphobacter glacialis]GGE04252.1 tyrosine protein kinase:aminoglycoside phosphotransferase [Polymorphobacter glacialis]